jgi:glutamate-1-semialdehyde 2,1-aminomutase
MADMTNINDTPNQYCHLNLKRSHELYAQAQRLFPGGVNSPVRAFRAVGGEPIFIDHGSGPYLYDVDGNRYLDFVQSWGPMILGQAFPSVVQAVQEASQRGLSFGAPTEYELQLGELITESMPSIELLRFVNSGTEATMSALRVARAYTKRRKIIKFAGNYHGHADMLLVQAGSGVATMGLPDSPGIPEEVTTHTLVAPYNDHRAVEELFQTYPDDIAAIIVEPVAANMGLVLPIPGFLQQLRELADRYGALLIFDEVITGFRVALGGMQAVSGVTPDLTCLGKIIGGGLPVGAYGGKRRIMEQVAPIGPVYQAGTLSGNPVAMAAGIATLTELRKPGVYEQLDHKGQMLTDGVTEIIKEVGGPLDYQWIGSMFCLFFAPQPVTDYATAKTSETKRYAQYFWRMLDRGIYLPPSQFETSFISLAMTDEMIEETVKNIRTVLHKMI